MRLTPVVRISLGLVSLTVSLLLLGQLIGLAPDRNKAVLEARKNLSESLAIQFSAAAQRDNISLIRETLQDMVARKTDIRSAAVRRVNGELLIEAGNHLANWQPPGDDLSTPASVQIPIFRGQERWATVEISFTPLWSDRLFPGLNNSYFSLILFVACAGFAGYFLLIKRTLRELDPAAVVPERVRAAFDVLQEGVLILDDQEQIVLANASFARNIGKSASELTGFKGSELGWKGYTSAQRCEQLPWMQVLRGEEDVTSLRLIMERGRRDALFFVAKAGPVLDGKGNRRGVIVTFNNVTELEEKNMELSQAVNTMQRTAEEIQTKNKELEFLATHDPMTLLLNRRAFNRRCDQAFVEANQHGSELSCIMCDIDHFKSVNDRYGHAAGDTVIKMVAGLLQKNSREHDLVGRLGGEEFCILLPGVDTVMAAAIADRIRQAIQKNSSSGIQVTMSFGISSLQMKAHEPGELINQADKALYIAKKGGRNRVVCWGDQQPGSAQIRQPAAAITGGEESPEQVALLTSEGGPGEQIEWTTEVQRLTLRLQEAEALAEKRAQELKYQAVYDVLTGLPTRTLFYDRLLQAILRGQRDDRFVAVLSISVDAVQRINEILGRDAGDLFFQGIGKRLALTLRAVDTVAPLPSTSLPPSVSRLGPGEFGVLLVDLEDAGAVTWVVKRIMNAFEQPFFIEGNEIYSATNIGVSIYPHDGQSPEALEKKATAAKNYARKNLGPNQHYFYSDSIQAVSIKHLQMVSQLHKAVQNEEFLLHYQPKIATRTGAITGVEALIRWQKPETGLVPPYEFIPLAESAGLIDAIGEWVLVAACTQVRAWLDMGLENCSVAVNFSNKQFRQKNLATHLKEILKKSRLEPKYLVVEVTESSLMDNINTSLDIFMELRELGVGIALDDFGTGYSSLGYLKKFPVTHVKIDRSFIAGIETNSKDATLVRSIINMAHAIGLKVTAEGVEHQAQAERLLEFDCDEMQGYFFSRPVPADEATLLLSAGITQRIESWEKAVA